jgi:hypothetical protein
MLMGTLMMEQALVPACAHWLHMDDSVLVPLAVQLQRRPLTMNSHC